MKKTVLLSLLLMFCTILYSCQDSKVSEDKFSGNWVSTLPSDSISVPVVIYKKGKEYVFKNTYNGKTKEYVGSMDKSNNMLVINIGGYAGKIWHLSDTDRLKMSTVNGEINFRRISPQEELQRSKRRIKSQN
nr:hypothetical protein [uncultured Pedobacter sp.]